MENGLITQQDIARVLNVSRVTVSKALRDHPDISSEMKEKVKETAAKMGYVPNQIARQLNSSKTSTIGIVVPDLENSFFSYIVDSIIDYATEKNYRVILTVSREKEIIEKQNIENLIGMRVDGLLVCNSQETKDTFIYSRIKKMGIPLVFFDRMVADVGFSWVVFNDREGAKTSLKKIFGEGYTRVAHFAGYSGINIGKERSEGYRASLIEHGITVRKDWIIEGGYELKDGESSFMRLLSLGDLPEVIFAVNDRVALGAYKAAKKEGFGIPEDIGIFGYGFSEITDFFDPQLTVINQDPRKMGVEAVTLLLNEIERKSQGDQRKIYIEEEFLWRNSV